MMSYRNPPARTRQLRLISAAVAACFASSFALANPTGPTVVNGTANIVPMGNVLQITNTPNAIINWQSFSIGAGELTKFIQQSSASAVLNRVITQNPSSILGTLQSNGRVFLINPNGILFGAGSQVDVGGLVASTLNLSDADFLAGRLRFAEIPGAGSVVNQGNITAAPGGGVYLVGPAVTNSGIITSPQGEVILAAGNSVELVDPGTPNLRVEITAPDNQALNLGQIIADSGRIGVYAGLINQSGVVQANTAVVTEDGRIVLKSTNNTTFAPGSITTATGPLEIEAGGDITVSGTVNSGVQTVSTGGGLAVRSSAAGPALLSASGGQTISARSIEVTAQDGNSAGIFNNVSGDQVITVAGGGTSPGIDVQSLASGGSASIGNTAPGAAQVITVTDADHINVNGFGPNVTNVSAIIHAIPGTQTISITGSGANAINVGSTGAQGGSIINARTQDITAGASGQAGSITIIGPAVNGSLAAISTNSGGNTQTISTSGALTISGGSAPAQGANFPSGIGHNSSGPQTVNAANIAIQGGTAGAGNAALISAPRGADQRINVSGDIALSGGAGGAGNFARIVTNSGTQTISAGNILLNGGGGTGNSALIIAPNQFITATGDVTLRGSPGVNSGARIGGLGGAPTNVVITTGGDLTLIGGAGSGAVIGSSGDGGQPTDIAINAGGNVTLNPGTVAGAGARIGSPGSNIADGNILVAAGGDIALNSAGSGLGTAINTLGSVVLSTLTPGKTITQGADSAIRADFLSASANGDISLTGNNRITSGFNAFTGLGGNIAFNNTSPNLTVPAISQYGGGALVLNQTGNLFITGDVSSGPQSISATGDLTVAPFGGPGASLTASGPQTIVTGGALNVFGGSADSGRAELISAGPTTVATGSDLRLSGGSGRDAHAWMFSNGDINLTVGGTLRLNAGIGENAWARVQTANRDSTINISFPNLSSGGWFVNDVEGALRRGLTGLLSGEGVAVPDHTLTVTYGEE